MARVDSRTRKKAEQLIYRAEAALLSERLLAGPAAHLAPTDARGELAALAAEQPALALDARLAELDAALARDDDRARYVDRHGAAGVRRFRASADVRVYALRVETFLGHINNVVAVVEPAAALLYDVGSGTGSSTRDLELGFAVARELFDDDVRLDRVDTAVVSHAHIDHFGGVRDLRERSPARISVHELDARVISAFEQRVVEATDEIGRYLRRAGVPGDARADMLRLYGLSRYWFRSQPVDRVLRDGDVVGGGHQVIHVPGHCPGLICLRVGAILLTSDHVLARITPHQFPESITAYAGLGHYFESLAKVRRLDGVALAIGGHEEPIADLRARVDAIEAFHRDRLRDVVELCRTPRTIHEVTAALFGPQEGYGTILAVEEAGAHIEYLHARGQLAIDGADGEAPRYVAAG
jgi:glyoxylase-like metal-dependent hydrolase (beta-lactamase superfamily II)